MVLQLGLGLLLVAALQHPSAAIPGPECPSHCGNVEIHYPFGIGLNCSLSSGFNATCQVQDGVSKPFIGHNLELLNISLTNSTIRVLNYISSYCYNASSGHMDGYTWKVNGTYSPYRFSDIQNMFTVIGCNTLAYIADMSGVGYQSGCVSTCENLSELTNGSCSGMGCCQTAIPRAMGFYDVRFDSGFNTSLISNFSRCSYAVLMEAEAFNFSTAYISTTAFNDTRNGRVPVVMDWAMRQGAMPCEEAKLNSTGTYACLSSHSVCADAMNGPGYLCNCDKGYQGNPYLPDGCHGNIACNKPSIIFVQFRYLYLSSSVFLVLVQMLMSAITAHALQEVFATTRKEGIGVLVEQEENFPIKAIHAILISA